ncbi:hypothetical protein H5410_035299 [Solanum commersonii]|uniref:Purple acid phosphatase n=1 Tax=Solanum commersonii TaxID=4109 RepID=A0A9J5Y094_SOLCO|nr:hypothetical protein H5410_035299 [Solanum commersonii]
MLLYLFFLLSLFLTFIDNGSAGITSAFIRTQFPSVDIPLENEVLSVPNGYNAPQQVHITQGDYDGEAVIISWVTADEPGSSEVRYGLSEGKYDVTVEGTLNNYTFYKYESGYIHQCLITGLQYDTKYYYEIGKGDSARKFWFETPPKVDPDASYKFGIIGDLGQTYNSLSTLQHYMASGAKSVLFVGDLSYADRYQYNDVGVRWDTFGRLVEQSTAYQPWIWSAGNHEIEYFPSMGEEVPFRSFLSRYPTPYRASKSSNPLWYAIRRASAHIIVLSSYSPFVLLRRSIIFCLLIVFLIANYLFLYCRTMSTWKEESFPVIIWLIHLELAIFLQLPYQFVFLTSEVLGLFQVKYTPQWHWLKQEFKKVNREKTPWLIVLMHVPIYNSNAAHFMEGESMRSAYERWFVKYKVDVIFAGHVHAYERSYRISNIHYNVSGGDAYPVPDKAAPIYITVGDGGNSEGLASRFRDPQPEYSAFREASYGHSTLDIKNRTHAIYHWNRNDDGNNITTDSFTLHNQYWGSGLRRRKLNKNHLYSVISKRPFTARF